jgi:hypothetical protein
MLIQCRDNNIPINGPILKAKALKMSQKLNVPNFKASDGWLDKFKTR